MPRQAQAQTTSSPVAGLVAFIQRTTDNLIVSKWRAAQRKPKTVSMDEPTKGRQDSDGEAGSRSKFIRDPSAHKEIENKADLAVRQRNAPLLREISKGLAQLSPQQRRIIHLERKGGGSGDRLPDKEIAKSLGTDSDSVKTQRSRALRKLAKYLNDNPRVRQLIMDSRESST